MASVSSPYGCQVISDQGGFAPRPYRIPFGIGLAEPWGAEQPGLTFSRKG